MSRKADCVVYRVVVLVIGVLGAVLTMSLVSGDQDGALQGGWPATLANRELRIVTPRYIIYCDDESGGDSLAEWLRLEVAEASDLYAPSWATPGLVIAIESETDPCKTVQEWYVKNVKRGQYVFWQDLDASRILEFNDGRPYCLSLGGPYFRESFGMPYEVARDLGIIDSSIEKPSWICFITTTEYLNREIENLENERRKEFGPAAEDLLEAPRGLDVPATLLFGVAFNAIVRPRWISADKYLTGIQRTETLREEIVKSVIDDRGDRAEELLKLHGQVHEAWMTKWTSSVLFP